MEEDLDNADVNMTENSAASSAKKVDKNRRERVKYVQYNNDDLNLAIRRIKAGKLTQRQASKMFAIPQATISRRVNDKQMKPRGRQSVFSAEEEKELVGYLKEVASSRESIGRTDLRMLVKSYLDKRGVVEPRFSNNYPGQDFIRSFIRRNNLTSFKFARIRTARASLASTKTRDFDDIESDLSDLEPNAVFYCEEASFKDDLDEKYVVVDKTTGRGQEEKKSTFTVMCCSNAAGEFLPPMVVYKSKHMYESWTKGGPDGSMYDYSASCWFDERTFSNWYFKVFVPFAEMVPGKKLLVGNKLTAILSPEVAEHAGNNIYLIDLPTNSIRPLDNAFTDSLRSRWRNILESWRKDNRQMKGDIPKPYLAGLVNKLWCCVTNGDRIEHLKSGFAASGVWPFNASVFNPILASESGSVSSGLSETRVEPLKDSRSQKNGVNSRGNCLNICETIVVSSIASCADGNDTITEREAFAADNEIEPEDQERNLLKQCGICAVYYSKSTPNHWFDCVECRKSVCSGCCSSVDEELLLCMNCVIESEMGSFD